MRQCVIADNNEAGIRVQKLQETSMLLYNNRILKE